MKAVPIALSFALAASLFAADQSRQTTPTFLETLEVRITNVDVVVTDRDGNPVRGLGPADFEVREKGVVQPITNFAEYTASGAPQAPSAVTAAAPAPSTASPPRRFVFFIDDMALHPEAREKLLSGARAVIGSQMRPGDEAMIVTPAGSQTVALGFTAEKELLVSTLHDVLYDQARFRATSRPVREEVIGSNEYNPRIARNVRSTRYPYTPATFYGNVAHRRVTSTLRTLLGVVGSLGQADGKKVLVVVTDSLPFFPGNMGWYDAFDPQPFTGPSAFVGGAPQYDVRPMLEEIAARANANGVTIYTIQPDIGVPVKTPGRLADNARPASLSVGAIDRRTIEATQETLTALADKTGGKYFFAEPSIDAGFRTIASDLSSYYSLAYRAPAEGADTIRDIAVRVKGRDDLVVRARRDILRRSPAAEMNEVVTANLVAPLDVNELGITATAAPPKRFRNGVKFDLAVQIPMSKLTFVPAGGKYRAAFTVHYAAADARNYTTGEMREQTVEIPAADVDRARTKVYTYTSTLVVTPGTAKVAVGVFDRISGLSGFQRLDVKAQ